MRCVDLVLIGLIGKGAVMTIVYVPVAYFDCREELGYFVELHGLNDEVAEIFDTFRMAHEQWDGVTDPVRARSKSSSR